MTKIVLEEIKTLRHQSQSQKPNIAAAAAQQQQQRESKTL